MIENHLPVCRADGGGEQVRREWEEVLFWW